MEHPNKQIFKIQVSLTSPPMVFLYNKERTSQGMFPLNNEIKKAMGNDLKKYFYGNHKEDGEIEILSEAEWQEW